MDYLSINGTIVENAIVGFHSFNVKGRNMPETQLETNTVGSRDGDVYQYNRYAGRTLTVSYAIIADSETALMQKFRQLNALLDAEECKIIFGDEPDVYYVGTKQGITEPAGAPHAMSGTIEFYCCNPFKYSVSEYETTTLQTVDGIPTFVVDYAGTMLTRPTIEIDTASDNGFVALFDDLGNIIQIGDPAEVDAQTFTRSDLIFNDDFQNGGTLAGWTQKNAPPYISGMADVGSMYKNSGGFVAPQSYGSGSAWHGVTATRPVTASVNGTFTWKHLIQATNISQLGSFRASIIGVVDGVEKHLAEFALHDPTNSRTDMYCRMYVNGQEKKSVTINGTGFSLNSATALIRKFGEDFTFTVRDNTYSFKCPELKDVAITKVGICFAQYSTNPFIANMRLYSAKFTKDYEAYEDVPNKFTAGDKVVIDCESGTITLNGNRADGLGAIGNAWENFGLHEQGEQRIGVTWSEWVTTAPTVKLKFREVFI